MPRKGLLGQFSYGDEWRESSALYAPCLSESLLQHGSSRAHCSHDQTYRLSLQLPSWLFAAKSNWLTFKLELSNIMQAQCLIKLKQFFIPCCVTPVVGLPALLQTLQCHSD
jgi:hypothetical protein